MPPRLVVLGWDSATFEVCDPLLEQGRLPALESLVKRGLRAPLRSSWPPMTDAAWTSAFTGRNPGAHGIFGSWYRAPGDYACRYFSARDRRVPALWEMADGVRWLVWNVPMTYPPQAIDGVMVAGYGAPPGAAFCSPADFQAELARRAPLEDLLDRAPHGSLERFRADLLRGLEAQPDALAWAAGEAGADCVVAVWPHIDRAQHFFWRFRGTDHPLAEVVDEVYEAADRATGRLLERWGDADVVVVSDHGAGPLLGDINLGSWLERQGHAAYGRARSSRALGAAWALPPPARKLGRRLAPGLARRVFSATLAGQLGSFDWGRTRAFAGFHGDLWINRRGREPAGCVSSAEADDLLGALSEELQALQDPDTGAPLLAGVHKGADLFSGPAVDLAPDLMLDSWSAGYRVAPGRERAGELVGPPAPLAGVEAPWSSDHRPLGIFVGAGSRLATGAAEELSLLDVCPLALALLEQPVPEGLDGFPRAEVLEPSFLARHPVRSAAPAGERAAGGEYSSDEAAAVASHLRDLGYID